MTTPEFGTLVIASALVIGVIISAIDLWRNR